MGEQAFEAAHALRYLNVHERNGENDLTVSPLIRELALGERRRQYDDRRTPENATLEEDIGHAKALIRKTTASHGAPTMDDSGVITFGGTRPEDFDNDIDAGEAGDAPDMSLAQIAAEANREEGATPSEQERAIARAADHHQIGQASLRQNLLRHAMLETIGEQAQADLEMIYIKGQAAIADTKNPDQVLVNDIELAVDTPGRTLKWEADRVHRGTERNTPDAPEQPNQALLDTYLESREAKQERMRGFERG